MQIDEETWAQVRCAYADASVTLSEISTRFGLTPQRIGTRAKKEGWPERKPAKSVKKRSAVAKADTATTATQRTSAALPTRRAQRALIGRIYRAISLKLEHMEKRMASGESRSAQDEERESRALATLINNFEKVTEAVAELDKDGDARKPGRTGADAERMRREIAERLERLGGGGPALGPSGKPRS
jgi:hypothetical protein